MKLSIIIPLYNESTHIPALVSHLHSIVSPNCEIILVDGGSSDATQTLLTANGFVVYQAAKGRSSQMNYGASLATGDVLLFLHADTQLPAGFFAVIDRVTTTTGFLWGRFDVSIAGDSCLLPVISAFINWRSRQFGIATGDQAIFVTRSTFESVDGFPQQPLMEDVEISKRLKQLSKPTCLSEKVVTSGRRWQRYGVWHTIFLMWRLRWLYWRGVDANSLSSMYR